MPKGLIQLLLTSDPVKDIDPDDCTLPLIKNINGCGLLFNCKEIPKNAVKSGGV
eukprot:TRINITY_DN7538_c0_g1_i1.p6 TRINITY_DN7538_c0_g1~~TRINITY_DN7538_c0_g1_i1.p6  ORF type:complete len:54 (-),score=13.24 TRINITY_DN7538_c0_g1_i1:537-698(-)